MKFTNKSIEALTLPAGKSDFTAWDDDFPNFGVRLRPGGSKVWTIFYRLAATKQQRRESLGDIRMVTLEDARKIAHQRFAQIRLGVDPKAERDKARAEAAVTKFTFAAAVTDYLDAKRAKLRPSSYAAAKRYFTVHWAPLRDRPLADIKRADIAVQLREIVKAHGPVAAARARANLSALLGWAMREGLCEANPVIATNNPSPPTSRDRVLSDDELRAVWEACSGEDDHSRIVKLLTLTGARRTEVAAMTWGELNLDSATWRIAGTRVKNKRDHDVPLSAAALDILRAVAKRKDRSVVFGIGKKGFTTWTHSKAALDERVAAAWPSSAGPFEPWTLHDLRRTVATGLQRLGVRLEVTEAILNHVGGSRGGVTGIYQRHNWAAEKADALHRWAAHVEALVSGKQASNVVPLAHRAR